MSGRRGDALTAAQARKLLDELPEPTTCERCGRSLAEHGHETRKHGPFVLHVCEPCAGMWDRGELT